MELTYYRLAQTAITVILFFVIRLIYSKIIDKTLSERFIQEQRGIVIKRVLSLISFLLSVIVILLIWGVKQADLAVLIGSVLTVVGVAFFAQWSLLSNVTSSVIIFFNHPVKMNDDIIILEGKDYILEGRVINIGLFFVTIETSDEGEITLPNNVFIQKSIKKLGREGDLK